MRKEINTTLKETILKSDLPETVINFGEVSIDSTLDEGVLRDIPILSSLVGIAKTYGNVGNYLITKKIFKFLSELSTLSSAERIKLIDKLESDEKYESNFGDKVIDLLNRIDDSYKPTLIAKAFKLYAVEHISYVELQRVNYSIERLLIYDLDKLEKFCESPVEARLTMNDPVTLNFINAGLAFVSSGFGGGGVHPSSVATLLIQVKNS